MAEAKYKQILDGLKKQILGAAFGPGNPFPSESAFARANGITRSTAHRVFLELVRLGLIRVHTGRVPEAVARKERSGKIGLIVPGLAYSEFFPPIVSEISRLAQARGYSLIVCDVSSKRPQQRVARAKRSAEELVRQSVAGVIYQPLELVDDAPRHNQDVVSIFDRAGVPVVLLDFDIVPPPERSAYDVVGINNMDAGYRLALHLLSVGAKRIHFVMSPNWGAAIRNRLRGVMTAVNRVGRFDERRQVFASRPDDVAALRRHLRRGRPDAFVCGNDDDAAVFKQTLGKIGLRVPDDVLLAGFDDVRLASLLTPPLTSVHQPCAEIAVGAFRRLLARIAVPDLPPTEQFFNAPLVVRESTCPPAKRMKGKGK